MATIEPFKINYRSDFSVKIHSDAGWATPFTLLFYCGNAKLKRYVASYDGTTYTNCHLIDANWLHVTFDDHALPVGQLHCIITYSLCDPCFATGVNDETLNVIDLFVTDESNVQRPVILDLEGETAPDIQFYLPQLAAEAERQANELERIANEEERESNEQTRQTQESTRQSQETTRQGNESGRESAEAERDTAEALREANEATRQQRETIRVNNESERQDAELTREDKEETRSTNELIRISNEQTRQGNEQTRQSQEATRQSQEQTRQTNEGTRQSQEATRQSNEQTRQTQETSRQEAETTRQQTFQTNEAQREATASEQRAEEAVIFEAKEDERDAAVAVATALTPRVTTAEEKVQGIEQGTNIPPYAGNLKSWAERSNVEVSDEWDAVPVRTTAGNLSVNTEEGGHLISIKSNGDFTASGFKASGFNLIITSQTVGGKPYILVPKGTFGTFGTADENNGVLLTASDGTNKKVALRFKAYENGVPTSLLDGVDCPYQDMQGYRFYLPPSAGYLFGSNIAATDCAHIAWSKDYDKYVAPSAFSAISFSTIINKFSSIGSVYHMLAVSKGGELVQDFFEFSANKFNYTKACGYDASAWTNTPVTDDEGTTTSYRHEKTISAMALNGGCEDYAGLVDLNVDGKTVYYEDGNATSSVAVKYELETITTGTVTLSNAYTPNDMGCEYIEGMSGNATVVTTYFQGIPDELASLPGKVAGIKADVERDLAGINAMTSGLTETLDKIITAKLMVALNLEKHYAYRGKPLRTYGIGYYTIKPTFGTAATVTFSYKVNTYAFVFDIELTATDTVFTFKEKFQKAMVASMVYLGFTPSVTILDDGSGIQISTDTDIEVEINTVACSGATLAEVSDHPTTAPAFIGQLYHNTNKKKEWEAKSILSASDWLEKY